MRYFFCSLVTLSALRASSLMASSTSSFVSLILPSSSSDVTFKAFAMALRLMDFGIVRSMSRKGCSPDNARAEGFFGRLKIEFFYERDWSGVTLEEFTDMLDAYLRWYRDVRLKSDLGYKSPMQYRRDLGLIA